MLEHNPQQARQATAASCLFSSCFVFFNKGSVSDYELQLYNYLPKKRWCYSFNFQYADEVKKPPRSMFGFLKRYRFTSNLWNCGWFAMHDCHLVAAYDIPINSSKYVGVDIPNMVLCSKLQLHYWCLDILFCSPYFYLFWFVFYLLFYFYLSLYVLLTVPFL